MCGGMRIMIRSFYAYKDGNAIQLSPDKCPIDGENVLIIGAGRAGEKVVREIKSSGQLKYLPIGFLDNDKSKRGRTIHGVPVLGPLSDLQELVQNKCVNEILIAVAEASGKQMREIIDACKETGLPYKSCRHGRNHQRQGRYQGSARCQLSGLAGRARCN